METKKYKYGCENVWWTIINIYLIYKYLNLNEK